MPQAFPNPVGSFTTGFLGGLQAGGTIQEQRARVEARQAEIQKEKFNKGIKLLELGASYSKIKDPAYRKQGMQFTKEGGLLLGMDMPETMPEFDDNLEEIRAGIEESIKGFRKFGDENVLRESLEGLYRKGGDLLGAAEIKRTEERTKRLVKQQEQAQLGQVERLPQLQKAGVITPAQAEEARITGLQAAGALKAPPAPGREQARTEALVSPIDGKVHKFQFNPKTKTFDIDLGLAAVSTANEFRTAQARSKILEKFNADPAVRRAESMISSADIIVDAVASNNPVANASLPTLMARASGEVGNLSEADKAPFGGSRALLARMKQVGEEMSTGLRTEENLKFIEDLALIFRKNAGRAKTRIARERAKQFSKGVTRELLSEEEIFGFLAPLTEFKESKGKFKIISVE